MSPNSLDNPFHHTETNKGTSSELTRRLLSSADAQALTEALGEDEPSKSEPQPNLPPADISMSVEEQREVEKEPYWIREQYIEWAEEVTEDKSWIDKIFKFQPDGTTIVEGNLNLLSRKIKQLPIGLVEVKGNLNISQNPSFKLNGYPKKVGGRFECCHSDLSSLQGIPEEIGENFNVRNNHLTSLVGLPRKVNLDLILDENLIVNLEGISKEVSGSLFLNDNGELISLEALKGVKIGGDLWLIDVPATEIPAGIEIGGNILINSSHADLIADAKKKGYQVKIL